MSFSLNCIYTELNGRLALNVRMCDPRSEITLLSERWIKEPKYACDSSWNCANRVFGIVKIVVTMIRMCCAGKMWLSYNATITSIQQEEQLCGII